ncbi:MAG: ferrous iron transport protein B [Erysipelotrichaceae bacterium]
MYFSNLKQKNDKINELYEKEGKLRIALVGNPNVGKSTVFNALTGLNQHTGNWPGKTVDLAIGSYYYKNKRFELIDLPGTYSLQPNSKEEQITTDFICFENCDVCMVICDSTSLKRNLNLVIQTLEITSKVVVCLNLDDEAQALGIKIDEKLLSEYLDCEVVKLNARSKKGFKNLKEAIIKTSKKQQSERIIVTYDLKIEYLLGDIIKEIRTTKLNPRYLAIHLLNTFVTDEYDDYLEDNLMKCKETINVCHKKLISYGIDQQYIEMIVERINKQATMICDACQIKSDKDAYLKDYRIDRIATNKVYGLFLMMLLLAIIFWITIRAANVPSQMLVQLFSIIEDKLWIILKYLHIPLFLQRFLMEGIYMSVSNVIAVMLPPMAIFFPMFTILEDLGYLPRIAFNLDGYFQKASACGKQALSMCMGFGCNAVGISGCRIIDSPRERLIAILTNNFVPCNGRFPTLIAIITMFFSGMFIDPWNGIISTLILMMIIILGIILTFITSKILSKTILKGIPSSFTLELPPYRTPQFTKVIVRSIFDRTLFVLGRAVSVAIPAGAIIFILANTIIGDTTLLLKIADFLNPFAHLMGIDGVILFAFILGFPANEIVVPIMIMAYMAKGHMIEISNLVVLKSLFLENGWTALTAICTMLFSLMHFPCATTILTIKKETNSWYWTIFAFLLPTIIGIFLCIITAFVVRLFLPNL